MTQITHTIIKITLLNIQNRKISTIDNDFGIIKVAAIIKDHDQAYIEIQSNIDKSIINVDFIEYFKLIKDYCFSINKPIIDILNTYINDIFYLFTNIPWPQIDKIPKYLQYVTLVNNRPSNDKLISINGNKQLMLSETLNSELMYMDTISHYYIPLISNLLIRPKINISYIAFDLSHFRNDVLKRINIHDDISFLNYRPLGKLEHMDINDDNILPQTIENDVDILPITLPEKFNDTDYQYEVIILGHKLPPDHYYYNKDTNTICIKYRDINILNYFINANEYIDFEDMGFNSVNNDSIDNIITYLKLPISFITTIRTPNVINYTEYSLEQYLNNTINSGTLSSVINTNVPLNMPIKINTQHINYIKLDPLENFNRDYRISYNSLLHNDNLNIPHQLLATYRLSNTFIEMAYVVI